MVIFYIFYVHVLTDSYYLLLHRCCMALRGVCWQKNPNDPRISYGFIKGLFRNPPCHPCPSPRGLLHFHTVSASAPRMIAIPSLAHLFLKGLPISIIVYNYIIVCVYCIYTYTCNISHCHHPNKTCLNTNIIYSQGRGPEITG